MEQYIDFVIKNWYLFLALAVILGLLVGSEVLRKLRGIPTLTPNEALKLVNDQDAVLLDTRDLGEYRTGHLPQAKHASLDTIKNRPDELTRYKDRPVILYCRSGMTSQSAAANLKKAGFGQVHSLAGGIQAWQNANLPLSKK